MEPQLMETHGEDEKLALKPIGRDVHQSNGRPILGSRGKPINLAVNAFALHLVADEDAVWWKFQVTTYGTGPRSEGREPLKSDLRQIWAMIQHNETTGVSSYFGDTRVIFDGKFACFAPKLLPQDPLHIEVKVPQRGTFKVSILNPTPFSPGELRKMYRTAHGPFALQAASEALSAINIIFTHSLSEMGYHATKNTLVLRKTHNPSDPTGMVALTDDLARMGLDPRRNSPQKLPDGLEICRAIYQSVRPHLGGLYLNVNVSSAVFIRQGSMIEFLKAFLNVQNERNISAASINPSVRQKMNKLLSKVLVDVDFGQGKKRRKIMFGLTETSARNTFFVLKDTNERISIEAFFFKAYNLPIPCPDLPCLKINDKVTYPLAFCSITPGNPYKKRLSSEQQKVASDFQTLPPEERRLAIAQVGRYSLEQGSVSHRAQFNLEAPHAEMMMVPGRVLAPPQIDYAPTGTSPVRDGAWQMQRNVSRFVSPVEIKSFAVVVRDESDRRNFLGFYQAFVGTLRGLGIVMPREARVVVIRQRSDAPGATLSQAMKYAFEAYRQPAELVFWILSVGNDPEYHFVKSEGVRAGIALQVLQSKNLRKGGDFQFVINVGMKLIAKLGGLSFKFLKNTMSGDVSAQTSWLEANQLLVFGADITHSEDKPSVAALTMNVDRMALHFVETVAVVPLVEPTLEGGRARKSEVITEIGAMVTRLLDKFVAINGPRCPPNSVIFFRDGVSQAEEDDLLKKEGSWIKGAFEEFKRNNPFAQSWSPKLTFIVCVKRHHVRFFTTERERVGQRGARGNVSAGTTVDTDLLGDPRVTDWFQYSHAGILGTSKPTHYRLLADEQLPRISLNDLESLTNIFSHAYQRCNRAVSMTAPVSYADLVCTRARSWFDNDSTTATSGYSSTTQSRRHDVDLYRQTVEQMRAGIEKMAICVPGSRRPPMWFL